MKARNDAAPLDFLKVKPLLIGVLSAAVVCVLGLLLSAVLMTFADLSEGITTTLSLVSAALGAFVGGMFAAKLSENRGWLMGLLCGLILFVLILLSGLVVHRSVDIGFLFVKSAVLLLGGMIGGMIGVNRK